MRIVPISKECYNYFGGAMNSQLHMLPIVDKRDGALVQERYYHDECTGEMIRPLVHKLERR